MDVSCPLVVVEARPKLAWLLFIAAALLMAGVPTAAAQTPAAPRAELIISFDLADGENVLYIQGNALEWHHWSGSFPGNIRINGIAWNPSWNDCVGKSPTEPCYSSYFHGAIAKYNPDTADATTLAIVGSASACGQAIGGFFCQLAGWSTQQYVQSFFYPRPDPAGASAYHIWLKNTGSMSIRVAYDYMPEAAFFDVVPNNTVNLMNCNELSGSCKALVGVWNAFALFAPIYEYPDGKVLWPAPAPVSPVSKHIRVTMSGDRFGTVEGFMAKSYVIDYDRDGNWDWVVPFLFPSTFSCTAGEVIDVRVDLKFPTGRHLRGTDVLKCP